MNAILPSSIALRQAGPIDPGQLATVVHKRFRENVLLTAVRGSEANRFHCEARIPTDNPLFNGEGRRPESDIVFFTEVGRQAGLAMAHLMFGAHLDDVFVFEGSRAALAAVSSRASEGMRGERVDVRIEVLEIERRKNGDISRLNAEHTMLMGGTKVFYGTGAFTIQDGALYSRLRRAQIEANAASSGSQSSRVHAPFDRLGLPCCSVLAGTEFHNETSEAVAALAIDRGHPVFFDHPCDHVPGMLLLEGCTQLALMLAKRSGRLPGRPIVLDYEVKFGRFVEFGPPTNITARRSDSGDHAAPLHTYELEIRQCGLTSGVAKVMVGSSDSHR